MLVVDEQSDEYYKRKGIQITKSLLVVNTLVEGHKGMIDDSINECEQIDYFYESQKTRM